MLLLNFLLCEQRKLLSVKRIFHNSYLFHAEQLLNAINMQSYSRYNVTSNIQRLDKTEYMYVIFVSLICSLLPKALHSGTVIFTAAAVVPCGARKRLPVHHHSEDYIFWSCPITGLTFSQFENRVPLKPVLGEHRSLNLSKKIRLKSPKS